MVKTAEAIPYPIQSLNFRSPPEQLNEVRSLCADNVTSRSLYSYGLQIAGDFELSVSYLTLLKQLL